MSRVRIAGALALGGCWLLGTSIGLTAAGLRTDAGRHAVAGAALEAANDALNGSITVGEITGSFLDGLVAQDVLIREAHGGVLAEIPHLQLRYGLRDILGGRIVLGSIELDSPTVNLIKRPGRRLNLEEVFGIGGGAGTGGPAPLIAFSDVRINAGTLHLRTPTAPEDSLRVEVESTPDGYVRVRRITEIEADLPYFRISSPLPTEKGIRVDIAALSALVSDPAIDVEGVNGRVEVRGDSVFLNAVDAKLPSSEAAVDGSLEVRSGRLMLDLTIQAETVATDDVRGLVSEIPSGLVGAGLVRVESETTDRMVFQLDEVTLVGAGGGGRASGRLAMALGRGTWAFLDTRLDLQQFDLEYIRAYFDTLPIAGRATGRFEANGPREDMTIGFDISFRDSLVEGWPTSTLDAVGTIAVGVPGDVVLKDYAVEHADLDLGTVRRILPGVDLLGRMSGSGLLNGPWLQMEFVGELSHEDDGLPRTDATGTVRVDARGDTLGVWAELQFDSLAVEGLHTSYPQLDPVSGAFTGRVSVAGYVDSTMLSANLEGPSGALFADGVVTLLPQSRGFSFLDLRVARLNLERLNPNLPETDLFGRLQGSAILDSASGSWARANASIRASSLEGVRTDSISVSLEVTEEEIQLDTLDVWGRELRLTGAGRIGISGDQPGAIQLNAANDSIAAIEPLLEALFGPLGAEHAAVGQPWGSLALELRVDGTLEDVVISGKLDARELQRADLYASRLQLNGEWSRSAEELRISGMLDSLELGRWVFAGFEGNVAGPTDSLSWSARTRFGPDGLGAWIAEGRLIEEADSRTVDVGLMGFLLASGAWFVDAPAQASVGDSGIDLSGITVSAAQGAGQIQADGRLPFLGSSVFETSVEALPLEDLWILLQRNYGTVGGDLGGSFTFTGTRDEPTMDLSVGMVSGRFGRFQVPQLLGRFGYRGQRVTGDLRLLRTGEEILNVAVGLPLNLSLRSVDRTSPDARISVQAVADGVDLSFMDAVTPMVQEASGTLDADFGLTGTWENPELTGRITIADGAAAYPGIGVRHENLDGAFRLSGDTIDIERLSMTSGGGSAQLSGFVRLDELTRPVLGLHVEASEFEGVDLRDFLALTATGQLELTGPVFQATATGEGTVTRGVLYYADLITKDIINIEDTLYTQFVDPILIRREGLGVALQNRFLDSLRVDSLRLHMGSEVWMRSTEANIQLLGDITVNKVRKQYSLNGTLQTPRGQYRVTPGPSLVQLVASREFSVSRGEVTYLGTADLNAAVDIEARHQVRSARGEDVTVIVHIGGTVYEPRLSFSSDINPPISETEVLSYLFFGAPSVEAFAGTGNFANQRLAEQGLNQFLGAVSGQLEYSLISDLKVPLDYVHIRPTGVGTEMYGVDVAVGKRLGEKWFVTVNPRLCSRDQLFAIETLRNVGASLEYRFSNDWLLLLSGDPVQSCSAFSTKRFAEKYQLGIDLLWEKRY